MQKKKKKRGRRQRRCKQRVVGNFLLLEFSVYGGRE